ncbi:MAG: HD domain-containing protein [Armatimonadetes bacterium]|nr:HD domain-containing protein [Armatimonadota bacterium]
MSDINCLIVGSPGPDEGLPWTAGGPGIRVQHSPSADAVCTILIREPVHAVVVSLAEDREERLQLIEVLAELYPDISIIAMLPRDTPDLAAAAVGHGAHGIVMLPLRADTLWDEIRQTVSRRRGTFERLRLRAMRPFLRLRDLLASGGASEVVLRRLAEAVQAELRADRASVICLEEETGQIAVASVTANGRDGADGGPGAYWKISPAQLAVMTGKAADNGGAGGHVLQMPLTTNGRTVGVLTVARDREEDLFSPSEREMLALLGTLGASPLINIDLITRLRQANDNLINALAHASELHEDSLRGHSERLAAYAVAIGRHLHVDHQMLEDLRIAAMSHDVGKIGVSDVILHKPGPLTPEEFEIVKGHTVMGAQILSAAQFPSNIVQWVLHHHERFDGRGYPAGLAEDQIPLGARILAVADAYEVMSTGRVYRRPLNWVPCVAELRTSRASQFDPTVVDAFLDALSRGEIDMRQPASGAAPESRTASETLQYVS